MSDMVLERAPTQAARLGVIDCDIHPILRSPQALHPYLSKRWRDVFDSYGPRAMQPFLKSAAYPKATPALSRLDSWPPNGGPPGSDLAFMRAQHLDPLDIEIGILQVLFPSTQDQRDLGLGAAMATALNDWQAAEWCDPEPRLRASITIAAEDAQASAAEIRRLAGDRRFASVFMTPRSIEPLGRKRYWPIYEAAVAAGLPIGIHTGGTSGHPTTPGGAPSLYIEDHYGNAIAMQATLTSLVLEGVMEAFPTLKFIMIEGGFGWAPSCMWRIDKHWARMRDEVPHLRMKPSDYIRRQVWYASQPIEEPEHPADMSVLCEWIGWDRIVFATDYPHWDMDDPRHAFKTQMSALQQRMVFADNARAAYGL
jgi:predicted TIM-barrel fold metal-dependent hydrolase